MGEAQAYYLRLLPSPNPMGKHQLGRVIDNGQLLKVNKDDLQTSCSCTIKEQTQGLLAICSTPSLACPCT